MGEIKFNGFDEEQSTEQNTNVQENNSVQPDPKIILGEGQNPIEKIAYTNDIVSQSSESVSAIEDEIALQVPVSDAPKTLFEDVSKREMNAKHYRMSDGTYQSVIYNEPIHYYNEVEGKFRGIDNTLELRQTASDDPDDFDGYQNKFGEVKVKLSRNVNDRNLLSIKKGEHKLTWKLLGKGSKAHKNNENDFGNLNNIEARIVAKAQKTRNREDKQYEFLEKLSEEVRYDDFTRGADLQYIVSGNAVKENIIIKERAESYEFAFKIKTKNLDIALSDDKQNIEFFITEIVDSGDKRKKVVFTLPSAYMYDADNKRNTEVVYEVETLADEKYLFKIIPNADWINSEERKFPVTIDPTIYTVDSSFIQSVTLWEKGGKYYDSASTRTIANTGSEKVYTYFKFNFPTSSNKRILSANLKLQVYDYYQEELEIRRVTSSWNPSTVTWGTRPTVDTTTEGYFKFNAEKRDYAEDQYINIDLTRIAQKSTNSINYGIMLKLKDENELGLIGLWGEYTSSNNGEKPVLIISYIQTESIVGNKQQKNSVNRAGTGILDLYTRNLQFVHDDISLNGEKMPLEISHIYNSRFANSLQILSSSGYFSGNLGIGRGWKTNLHQYVFPCSSISNLAPYSHEPKYVYIDQMGNENVLVKIKLNSVGDYEIVDENGKNLTYNESEKTLTDKNGNKLFFNYNNQLYKLQDSFGNYTTISFYGDKRISSVTDGSQANRTAIFNYSGTTSSGGTPLLSSITYANNNRKINYDYDFYNRLTKITYKDGTSSTYAYGESGASLYYLTSVRDQIGYRLSYIYGENSVAIQESTNIEKIADTSVTNCAEKNGNKIDVNFIGNKTYIKTKDGKRVVHIFDKSGNAYCSYVDESELIGGNYTNVANDIQFTSAKEGDLFAVSSKKEARNYITNSSFEDYTTCWSANNLGACDVVTGAASVIGDGSYKITGELNKTKFITQSVAVFNSDSYVLYGFAKAKSLPTNESTKFCLTAKILYTDGSSEPERSSDFNYLEQEWQLAAIGVCKSSRNKSKIVSKIIVKAEYSNNLNEVFFDNIRLVNGKYIRQSINNNYFICRNGTEYPLSAVTSIRYKTENWFFNIVESHDDATNGKLTHEDIENMIFQDSGNGNKCVYINGEQKSGSAVNGPIGLFNWGGTAYIYFVIGGKEYNIFDHFSLRNSQTIEIEDGSGQTARMKINLDGNIEETTIIDEYGHEFSTGYSYEKGKQKSVTDYYRNITATNLYDGYGNLCNAKTVNTSDKDTTNASISEFTYNNSGNTLYKTVEARGAGYDTITSFDNTFGRLNAVTLPGGQQINYNYYDDDSLNGISTILGTDVVSSAYNYTRGLLTNLTVNNNSYRFEYDGFGKLLKTLVNGQAFLNAKDYNDSTYTSEDKNTFNYSQVMFNNGTDANGKNKSYKEKTILNKNQSVVCKKSLKYDDNNNPITEEILRADYDSYDRINNICDKSMGVGKEVTYNYTYKDDGRLDYATLSGYHTGTLKEQYDKQERLTNRNIEFGQSKNYAYYYDKTGNSTIPDGRLSSINLPTGATTEFQYDNLGRLKKRSTNTGNCSRTLSESFGYLKSNYNDYICQEDRTTQYISTVSYSSYDFSANAFYTYDKRGNISAVTDSGKNYSYEYDGISRLTRENNQALGVSRLYTYDANGNIKTIKEYDFSAGEPSSNEKITTYTYDSGTHKDRLIKVSTIVTATGAVIEDLSLGNYDGIGNPCLYRENVVIWERGSNLAEYGGNKYRYNASGIRQEKETSAGVLHKYFTDGDRIHKEERGSNTLWYYYDETGVTGVEYNGARYYFQKNIQGDIIRIFDEWGTLTASYIYDAWGNHKVYTASGIEATDAAHIGCINPFRYRGYYYDTETDLFYLNSRYYDPKFGRFINADDVRVCGAYSRTLNGLNLYSYCLNNPVMQTDPSGHLVGLIVGLILASVGFVLATNALFQAITSVMRNPSGINIFWLVVSAIFWVISLISLISAVVNLVQAVKAIGALSSTALVTQGADDVVKPVADKIFIQAADKADFTDDAWKLKEGLQLGENGTKSSAATGRQIHSGYKFGQVGKEFRIAAAGRADFVDRSAKIIYELKPNNFKSIMQGISQLNRYNNALGKGYKLILVLY